MNVELLKKYLLEESDFYATINEWDKSRLLKKLYYKIELGYFDEVLYDEPDPELEMEK